MIDALELWHNRSKSWQSPAQLPKGVEGEICIRSRYSMISAGTERVVTTQAIDASIASNMAVPYMKGSLSQEFTYGYSLVGEVVTADSDLSGQWVHVMHPHQNWACVRGEDAYVLPVGMDVRLATLISNMETVVNAIWDARIELGDRVLIIGYGLIGALLAAMLRRYPGLNLEVMEQDPARRHLITQHQLDQADPGRGAYDVVLNTSSSEDALNEAFQLTRIEGTVVEISWYGNNRVNLALGADFHYGRKRLICSQVSHVPMRKQPAWDYKTRKDLVVRLLQEINPVHLIQHEVPFEEAPGYYEKLRSGEIQELSTIIKY